MQRLIVILTLFTLAGPGCAEQTSLDAILSGEHRPAEHRARDVYRHPAETLAFFELEPDMTVVEIWPGGGWYTEILAPYLREEGKLYAAHFSPESSRDYFRQSREKFMEKLEAEPALYDRVEVTRFDPPTETDIAPAASVDRVLTFRNVHNWYMRGGGEERLSAAFDSFFRALKPGGILGVVDHRLPQNRPLSDQEESGYMRQDYVIEQAEAAGFELVAESPVNNNPKDTADHPAGVWTLPPSLRLGEENREHYEGIGESDRMTLKFVKPE